MNLHEKINYVELPAKDLPATKAFFQSVFGWSFVDYGPDYTSFQDGRLSDEKTREVVKGYMAAFAAFVDRIKGGSR